MDYDDLYKKMAEEDLKSSMIKAIQGDGTGNYVKDLLSPTISVCQYCGIRLMGTAYENAAHVSTCINRKMAEEVIKERDHQKVRQSLLGELKKLL